MSEQQEKGTNWVAVITMMFIYGMISFVTNLAAPMGNVWKYQPGIEGWYFQTLPIGAARFVTNEIMP